MTDQKLTELTALAAAPIGTDILYVVDDPGGTPLSRSLTMQNLADGVGDLNITIDGSWTWAATLDMAGNTIDNIDRAVFDGTPVFDLDVIGGAGSTHSAEILINLGSQAVATGTRPIAIMAIGTNTDADRMDVYTFNMIASPAAASGVDTIRGFAGLIENQGPSNVKCINVHAQATGAATGITTGIAVNITSLATQTAGDSRAYECNQNGTANGIARCFHATSSGGGDWLEGISFGSVDFTAAAITLKQDDATSSVIRWLGGESIRQETAGTITIATDVTDHFTFDSTEFHILDGRQTITRTGAIVALRLDRPEILGDGTSLARININGFDDASAVETYARISGTMEDDDAAAPHGGLQFLVDEGALGLVQYMRFNENKNTQIAISRDVDMLGNTLDNAGIINSNAANPATAGFIRGGNATDAVAWRNVANTNNVDIIVSAADAFLFRINGTTEYSASPTIFDLFSNALNWSTDGHSITPAATTLTIDASVATDTLQLQTGAVNRATINDLDGLAMVATRHETAKGANVASGSALTLGTDGNTFTISGTTTINTITPTNWQTGSVVHLHFLGIVTVTNNSGGANDILLGNAANMTTVAGDVLTLFFDGTDWVEISRSVVSAGGGGGCGWDDIIIKTSDETICTDTVLSADAVLKFAAAANKKYIIEGRLFFTTGAPPDFKYSFTIPTNATGKRAGCAQDWNPAFESTAQCMTTQACVIVGGQNTYHVPISGEVQTGACAGCITLTWAQRTSSACCTTVNAGSSLRHKVCS